jgi:hypothetical protein
MADAARRGPWRLDILVGHAGQDTELPIGQSSESARVVRLSGRQDPAPAAPANSSPMLTIGWPRAVQGCGLHWRLGRTYPGRYGTAELAN